VGVIGVIGVELVRVSGGTLIGTFLLERSFEVKGFTVDNDNEGDDTLVLFVLPEDTEDGGADDLL
jgi:hypothetical protein